jgi:cysteine desulfurase
MQIYLDYSATTPTCPEAIALMQEVLAHQWGNPSSLHAWGQQAAVVLERSREQVARLLNAPPETIVFTSGGTESNNLAVIGLAQRYATPQHMITSGVEHSAIEQPMQRLEQQGWQVTRLPVDRLGRIQPADLQAALQPNTVMVSVIYGQSEIGTLQPIADLCQITQNHGALFHTDAVQAAGRVPLDVQQLPVDLLSLSSHKLYGPQGAGALYIRSGVELTALMGGGGQESKLRSGTQALPAIAGFGIAAELMAQDMMTEIPRLIGLRDRLFDLLADVPELVTTGDRIYRLPHHVSFCLPNSALTGKLLVRQMNGAGIGISAGSACSSGTILPSPVLLAMGYSDRAAKAGIRLTLGRQTTIEDIDWTVMVLKQVLTRLSTPSELTIAGGTPTS